MNPAAGSRPARRSSPRMSTASRPRGGSRRTARRSATSSRRSAQSKRPTSSRRRSCELAAATPGRQRLSRRYASRRRGCEPTRCCALDACDAYEHDGKDIRHRRLAVPELIDAAFEPRLVVLGPADLGDQLEGRAGTPLVALPRVERPRRRRTRARCGPGRAARSPGGPVRPRARAPRRRRCGGSRRPGAASSAPRRRRRRPPCGGSRAGRASGGAAATCAAGRSRARRRGGRSGRGP